MKQQNEIQSKFGVKKLTRIALANQNMRNASSRPSTTSSFREMNLNAAALFRKQSQSRLRGDKERVPISDEQIDHMIDKIKKRQSQNQEKEQRLYDHSQTYDEKLQTTKYVRTTKKYFKT